jgi:hypothetical protein
MNVVRRAVPMLVLKRSQGCATATKIGNSQLGERLALGFPGPASPVVVELSDKS